VDRNLLIDRASLASAVRAFVAASGAVAVLVAGCSSQPSPAPEERVAATTRQPVVTCSLGDQCAPDQPCPDLTIDAERIGQTARIEVKDFSASDCALLEGCVNAPGRRVLLRFDTATPNVGTADLVLGNPRGNEACFEYSSCHNHYHFHDYARYLLQTEDGVPAAKGYKQAFCLEDYERMEGTPELPPEQREFTCSNQGIHKGYQDIYKSRLDCQWVDVTGVPSGDYWLDVDINFNHVLPESNYENNSARVKVTIPDTSDPCQLRGGGCRDCTSLSGCGFCGDSNQCASGTATGPTSGTCAEWTWRRNRCAPDPATDPCPAQGGCGSCTALSNCGWCSSTGGCAWGTSAGPNVGSCGEWTWRQSQCHAPEPPDAGTDASTEPDAATEIDASPENDAAIEIDGSPEVDANPEIDAAIEIDAGAEPDATVSPEEDAGGGDNEDVDAEPVPTSTHSRGRKAHKTRTK
jgi:hypothetical protein